MITLIITLFVTGICILLLGLIVKVLAERDIFFLHVENGTVAYKKKGETITEAVWACEGQYLKEVALNDFKWENGKAGKVYHSEFSGPIDWLVWNIMGLRWGGLYPWQTIDTWNWSWMSYNKDHLRAENGVVRYKETLRRDFIRAVHYREYDIVLKGNWHMKVRVAFTVVINNPLRAHSYVKPKGAWLNKLDLAAQERFLAKFNNLTYEEVIQSDFVGENSKNTLYQFFFGNTATNINTDLKEFGIEVTELDWLDPILEEDEEIREATKATKLVEEKAKADLMALQQKTVQEEQKKKIAALETETFIAGKLAQEKAIAELYTKNPALVEIEKAKLSADALKNTKVNTLVMQPSEGGMGMILGGNDKKSSTVEKPSKSDSTTKETTAKTDSEEEDDDE